MMSHEDDEVKIIFDPKSENRGNGVQPVFESNDEQLMEIRVLLCKHMVGQQVFTVNMPALYNELDIVTAVFPNSVVLRDSAGYKILNDNMEQRAEVTHANDPKRTFAFRCVINVQSVTEIPPKCTSPNAIDAQVFDFEDLPQGSKAFNQQVKDQGILTVEHYSKKYQDRKWIDTSKFSSQALRDRLEEAKW